jgi:5-hydroxyisourate hydrolase
VSACLTTHILDLTSGKPANLVKVELYNSTEKLLKTAQIGDYFRETHLSLEQPPFLNKVPMCFYINDSTQHHHVPFFLSPWGYQIYRGS